MDSGKGSKKLLSNIIPILNEETLLPELYSLKRGLETSDTRYLLLKGISNFYWWG